MDVEKKKRAQSCITVALYCVFLFGFAIVTIAKQSVIILKQKTEC